MSKQVATLLCLAAFSSAAFAGGREAGSLLLFPQFDSRPGSVTILTVTNTNSDTSFDYRTGLHKGTVDIEYRYINAADCSEFNRTARLTPNDTISVLAGVHDATAALGYVYVFALDPLSRRPIDFDYLIGEAVNLNTQNAIEMSFVPFVFKALTGQGNPTDLDNDGRRDLNGLEYEGVADKFYFPRFFGQGGPAGMNSDIVLINVSGGGSFDCTVDFFTYNDNEQKFSSEYTFRCWTRVPLVAVSSATTNDFLKTTIHDTDEMVGFPTIETGWLLLNGGTASSSRKTINDPAVIAVLLEKMGGFASSALPFETREKQFNGSLLPRGVDGDNAN